MTNNYLSKVDRFFKRVNIFNIILSFIITFIILVFFPSLGGYFDTHYSTTATVLNVDDTSTTFVDCAGYLWAVNDTDYHKGQTVKIKFFNNCTDYTREDDEILNVKLLDD